MRPRFVADANVGKLARWLRIMGYDVLFPVTADDDDLLRIAARDGRVLLTRDSGLAGRRRVRAQKLRVLLLEHEDLAGQLQQVSREFELHADRLFTRCLRCNVPLTGVRKRDVAGLVPPYVYLTQRRFRSCPECGRHYWRGTHWARMEEHLRRLVESEAPKA